VLIEAGIGTDFGGGIRCGQPLYHHDCQGSKPPIIYPRSSR
jgi:hypothetical protein